MLPAVHLYLHIPFCHRICPYCSFYKHTPGDTDLGQFIEMLLKEAESRSSSVESPLRTIYLGGGTPSMLSPTHLRRLFEGLREQFDCTQVQEINLEANPATFGSRTAEVFVELGITRISLGAQSFSPQLLETLGRQHQPADIRHSVELLRAAGMPRISIDLMFSLPGQSLDHWEDSLEQALDLDCGHLSAYNLTYEEDTPFFERFSEGAYQDDSTLNAAMFNLAHERLTVAGYRHYETSNYARSGDESCHNQSYWEGADYIGLGPSAVSTIGSRRWKNVPDTARYLAQVAHVGHAEHEIEELSSEQRDLERIALMLRTDRGVAWSFLGSVEEERIAQICKEGLAELRNDRLILVGNGPLLVDSIVEHLV